MWGYGTVGKAHPDISVPFAAGKSTKVYLVLANSDVIL